MNVVFYNNELDEMKEMIDLAQEKGVKCHYCNLTRQLLVMPSRAWKCICLPVKYQQHRFFEILCRVCRCCRYGQGTSIETGSRNSRNYKWKKNFRTFRQPVKNWMFVHGACVWPFQENVIWVCITITIRQTVENAFRTAKELLQCGKRKPEMNLI